MQKSPRADADFVTRTLTSTGRPDLYKMVFTTMRGRRSRFDVNRAATSDDASIRTVVASHSSLHNAFLDTRFGRDRTLFRFMNASELACLMHMPPDWVSPHSDNIKLAYNLFCNSVLPPTDASILASFVNLHL
jgi:hypothetical protein